MQSLYDGSTSIDRAPQRVEHQMNFKDTTILARMTGYIDHLVKETIEVQLEFHNFNRNMEFILNPFILPGHHCASERDNQCRTLQQTASDSYHSTMSRIVTWILMTDCLIPLTASPADDAGIGHC
jgi:hypothetical protein